MKQDTDLLMETAFRATAWHKLACLKSPSIDVRAGFVLAIGALRGGDYVSGPVERAKAAIQRSDEPIIVEVVTYIEEALLLAQKKAADIKARLPLFPLLRETAFQAEVWERVALSKPEFKAAFSEAIDMLDGSDYSPEAIESAKSSVSSLGNSAVTEISRHIDISLNRAQSNIRQIKWQFKRK